ncbi:MAG TPA: ribosomal RNA small subunit methyltransferase A [Synergistaceae bacterium]|jgi:16S rRNA (adenine1518-N6/adenine1519-N6)-dimethyltransferase|uniref:16S rRNA (adenine(1518)-N(6)/adenine(1519)-N(6))- dimethyltransferase RsmA n=1 Tax=Synergistaceae TaxID=649777 RepID=UPI000EDDE55C|nr:16S rRNA (adenine(1518)-N(6)/adenine(1519)-N(6))-dimethyltransferase RsmA [Synergistaceae bacterium DZ-S4]HAH69976.1 ribosomal RNA small subunit methyltransferase A [Synergistaceae bacterium]
MVRIPNFIHNTDIGQNFLIDRSIVDFMIGRAKLTPEDKVLEIGPGEGILTEGLLSTECSGVCTVELDTRLKHTIDMLAIKDSRLHPLWGDAVQFDYENKLPWMPNRVIANLPYHITTPLLWVFLEKLVPHGLDYMLLMVQLESAQRITSPHGHRERSPLGITVEAMGTSAILRNVPPSAFRPQPRVNSCIIEIKIENNSTLACDRTWRGLLARSFTQRRKTLINNWISGYTEINREKAIEILERNGLKTTARAEELPLDVWQNLSREPEFYLRPKAQREERI